MRSHIKLGLPTVQINATMWKENFLTAGHGLFSKHRPVVGHIDTSEYQVHLQIIFKEITKAYLKYFI